jgi:hypothetical protein
MSDENVFVSFEEDQSSYVEEHPVEEGEYEVRITSASVNAEKGFIAVRLEVIDDPYAKEISVFLNMPGSGRTEKEENRNRGRRLDFFSCFDIDPSVSMNPAAQEPEGWVGREGYVMLSAPKDKDDGYGPQNNVKRFSPRR